MPDLHAVTLTVTLPVYCDRAADALKIGKGYLLHAGGGQLVVDDGRVGEAHVEDFAPHVLERQPLVNPSDGKPFDLPSTAELLRGEAPEKEAPRVGAILGRNEGTKQIFLLGYGQIEGEFVPHEAAGAEAARKAQESIMDLRIRLDNGKVVYACECDFVASEEVVKESMDQFKQHGFTIEEIDIDDARDTTRKNTLNMN